MVRIDSIILLLSLTNPWKLLTNDPDSFSFPAAFIELLIFELKLKFLVWNEFREKPGVRSWGLLRVSREILGFIIHFNQKWRGNQEGGSKSIKTSPRDWKKRLTRLVQLSRIAPAPVSFHILVPLFVGRLPCVGWLPHPNQPRSLLSPAPFL